MKLKAIVALIAMVSTQDISADQQRIIDDTFAAADTNKDGLLSEKEITDYMHPVESNGGWSYYWGKAIHYTKRAINWATFRKFDKNKDGLDKVEYSQAYKKEIAQELANQKKPEL